MFNQTFIDHWNYHPLTVETHKHWFTDPNYKPEFDLVAIAPDGTFAAFCFCYINPEENEHFARKEGWIADLGTRRGFRKIGLGRAMLLAGLHQLKAAGMDTAKLGVDADNPNGASRLVTHSWRLCLRECEAEPEPPEVRGRARASGSARQSLYPCVPRPSQGTSKKTFSSPLTLL